MDPLGGVYRFSFGCAQEFLVGLDAARVLQFPSGEVKCRERLGGLLKHYYREAA